MLRAGLKRPAVPAPCYNLVKDGRQFPPRRPTGTHSRCHDRGERHSFARRHGIALWLPGKEGRPRHGEIRGFPWFLSKLLHHWKLVRQFQRSAHTGFGRKRPEGERLRRRNRRGHRRPFDLGRPLRLPGSTGRTAARVSAPDPGRGVCRRSGWPAAAGRQPAGDGKLEGIARAVRPRQRLSASGPIWPVPAAALTSRGSRRTCFSLSYGDEKNSGGTRVGTGGKQRRVSERTGKMAQISAHRSTLPSG